METLELTVSNGNVEGGEFSVRFGEMRLSPRPFTVEHFSHRDNKFDIAGGMPTRLDMLVQQLQRIGQINGPIHFSYDRFKACSNPSASPLRVGEGVRQAVEASFNATFPWIVLNDHTPGNWAVCFNATLTATHEASDELEFGDVPPKELLPLGVVLADACKIEGLHIMAVDKHHLYLSVEDRPREEELDDLLNQALLRAIGTRGTKFTWHSR